MKPYIFSVKDKELNNKDWHQGGEDVEYISKKTRYPFVEDYLES